MHHCSRFFQCCLPGRAQKHHRRGHQEKTEMLRPGGAFFETAEILVGFFTLQGANIYYISILVKEELSSEVFWEGIS